MRIFIKVKTGARKESVEKIDEDNYIIFVKERPEKGLANRAVIRTLSRHFGILQQDVKIISGLSSRKKIIKISSK